MDSEKLFSERMVAAINEQIHAELESFYHYLAMAAYCDSQKFHGCANWFRMQSQEEHAHAMRLYHFLVARDLTVVLKGLNQPDGHYDSILDVFETSLKQEQQISHLINKLYKTAVEENAYTSTVELQWFLTEQVEEEKTIRDIVFGIRMVKDDPAAMLEWDAKLGGRIAEE